MRYPINYGLWRRAQQLADRQAIEQDARDQLLDRIAKGMLAFGVLAHLSAIGFRYYTTPKPRPVTPLEDKMLGVEKKARDLDDLKALDQKLAQLDKKVSELEAAPQPTYESVKLDFSNLEKKVSEVEAARGNSLSEPADKQSLRWQLWKEQHRRWNPFLAGFGS